jgi:hypothetical protein
MLKPKIENRKEKRENSLIQNFWLKLKYKKADERDGESRRPCGFPIAG